MNRIHLLIQQFYQHIIEDSLYRNSVFLLTNNLLLAFFGFVFWAIASRIFTSGEIGIATTLISAVDLVSVFALLGMNISLVRFLPNSERKNDKINSTFTVITTTSIIGSIIFLIGLKLVSPDLLFIRESFWFGVGFTLFVVFSSLSETIKSVFRSYLASQYVLIKNSVFNIVKLCLIFLLSYLGAFGIVSAWMIGLSVSVIISLIILKKKFSYAANLKIHTEVVKKMMGFSFANYITEFFERIPRLALPLLITTMLNPESTAYYYINMSLAAFLFMIPEAISSSLYAEGSTNEDKLLEESKKVLKAFAITVLPAMVVMFFLGRYALLIFGAEYSTHGFGLLQILTLATIPTAANAMLNIIIKIKYLVKELMLINAIGAIVTLSVSYFVIPQSFHGIGWAWFLGQSVMSVCYILVMIKKKTYLGAKEEYIDS